MTTKNLKEGKKVPKLRFSTFSDYWNEYNFGDFLINEIREVKKPEINYKAVGIRSHFKGTFLKPDSDPEKNVMETLFLVKENDLIVNITFAWEGALAMATKNDDGGLVSHRFPTYVFDEKITSHNYFRYIYSNKKMKNTLVNISPGGAGRNRVLSKKDFLKIKINLPSISEQEKIASFLSVVDEWIENLRMQKENLELYKKGMMQKVFSQEIRFKDEHRKEFPEWKEKKLVEVFKIIAGKTKSELIVSSGQNIIVDMGGISADGKLIANKMTSYSDDFLTVNDLVMPKDDIGGGLIIGRVAKIPVNQKYICGDHIFKLTLVEGVIGYLFYAINSFSVSRSLRKKANGTAQLGLSKGSVEDQEIPFPSVPEQQKIANFLTSLDKGIESKQQQISQAEQWKKGLMQGLFV